MSKYVAGFPVALVVLSIALTGCGGGGGSSNNPNPNPPNPTERTITGKIVSSATANPALANVAVTIGSYTAVSAKDGTFSLGPMPIASDIPSLFTVDASAAGTGYSKEDVVTYQNQDYLYSAVDTPVQIRNGDTNSLGTITIRYDPEGMPPVPFADKDTIISGRVVRSDDQTVGIAGVKVTFGTATTFTTTTGAKGYFALNVGRDVDVVSLFLLNDKTFAIDTSTAGSSYPNTLLVTYQGQSGRAQNDLPVPDDVLSNRSNDLGNIVVQIDSGGGDGTLPPLPPF